MKGAAEVAAGTTTTTTTTMGIERAVHNPDQENLKSLLKRPGGGSGSTTAANSSSSSSHRVVFNEKRNEFFDADYIILIREECDYDEDDEEDGGVCTCGSQEHELMRITCCEPNCSCGGGGFEERFEGNQSPKFAPPVDFVDAVTLSPPEGYKDLELEEDEEQLMAWGQRTVVCSECSVVVQNDHHGMENDDECCGEDSDCCGDDREDGGGGEITTRTNQSQQTTPTLTSPTTDEGSGAEGGTNSESGGAVDKKPNSIGGSCETQASINGILKGGKLWKQFGDITSTTKAPTSVEHQAQISDCSTYTSSDEESTLRRSVRFTDAPKPPPPVSHQQHRPQQDGEDANTNHPPPPTAATAADATEMMLTFKLGNHVLISNNSLRPNSAVRQLFPCTKNGEGEEEAPKYLVTAESLRAFEEAKRSKLPQIIQDGKTNDSIKRAIERNTLRRSFIRYEPRKKNVQKDDNSLVERIKQLTCVDDDPNLPAQGEEVLRTCPSGEEETSPAEEQNKTSSVEGNNSQSSPSSTSSSSLSSSSSTKYNSNNNNNKKLLLNNNNNNNSNANNNNNNNAKQQQKSSSSVPEVVQSAANNQLPDLANNATVYSSSISNHKTVVDSSTSTASNAKKQFLASFPLTACVSGAGGGGGREDFYYDMNHHHQYLGDGGSANGERPEAEYTLEDIDEGLKKMGVNKSTAPDVLVGTPSASESGDELSAFVQQDAGRIERIKKKYQQSATTTEEDDEHDDYGFNKRPTVRGIITPRYGFTSEILNLENQQYQQQQQQQQQQTQTAPTRISSWPYYSDTGLNNINQPTYVSTGTTVDGLRPPSQSTYASSGKINGNNQQLYQQLPAAHQQQYYQSLVRNGSVNNSRNVNNRAHSPPPLELSKNCHQTVVYIPYNNIENLYQSPIYYQQQQQQQQQRAVVNNQNQINSQRFNTVEPVYQQKIQYSQHIEHHHYTSSSSLMRPVMLKPYASRSESPSFSTARSTQTCLNETCPVQRYTRPQQYTNGSSSRFYLDVDSDSDSLSLNCLGAPDVTCVYQSNRNNKDSQHLLMPASPTKMMLMERGVPEGAASGAGGGGYISHQEGAMNLTSPTGGGNAGGVIYANQKTLFYAMNV